MSKNWKILSKKHSEQFKNQQKLKPQPFHHLDPDFSAKKSWEMKPKKFYRPLVRKK